jgi:hypothetical protein
MGVFQNSLMGAAAAAASAGGGDFYTHQIANSCRFNRADNSKMSRALGTATANTKWTLSTWVKPVGFSSDERHFMGGTGSTYGLGLGFRNVGSELCQLAYLDNPSGNRANTFIFTKKSFRDPSAWYHIVVNQDTTLGTASDRIKFYINGELQTDFDTHTSGGSPTPFYPSQNSATINDASHTLFLGTNEVGNVANSFDGYLAETYFIDGTAYAGSDFAETKNGVWIPKDASGLTFGNNGFYLNYASSADLGNDVSGNNNDYTVANIAAHDQMLDSPTFSATDGNGGNFSTLLAIEESGNTSPVDAQLSEGNLKLLGTNLPAGQPIFNSMMVSSGKWYAEFYCAAYGGADPTIGIAAPYYNSSWGSSYDSGYHGAIVNIALGWNGNGTIFAGGSSVLSSPSYTAGDILSLAGDLDGNAVYAWKNGTAVNSGSAIGSSPFISGQVYVFGCQTYNSGIWIANYGQDSTFAGATTAGGNADTTGYGNFKYAPPTDFLAICSGNLPVADAIDPAQTDDNYPQKLFSPLLYTGTGSSNARTGLGFKPDLTWIKERSGANDHKLTDSTRGVTKSLESNEGTAEATDSNGLTAFGTDGFTVGSDAVYNNNTDTYASWNWRANGGTTSTNSNGSENDTTVQVDPSGGFSIATWAGSGSTGTLGHGLSSAPTFYMVKDRENSNPFAVYAEGAGATKYQYLYANTAFATGAMWNDTAPTSTVFSVTSNTETNASGRNYVGYFFADVEGFIKSGSYIANSNADNAFVYTGFRPAFLMVKGEVSGAHWQIIDNKIPGYNATTESLDPSYADASYTSAAPFADLLSNGFKVRTTNAAMGSSSYDPYVYLAMAENPFKYATAR